MECHKSVLCAHFVRLVSSSVYVKKVFNWDIHVWPLSLWCVCSMCNIVDLVTAGECIVDKRYAARLTWSVRILGSFFLYLSFSLTDEFWMFYANYFTSIRLLKLPSMRINHRKIHTYTHITYNHNKSFCTICLNLLPGNRLLVLILCHKSQLFDM